MTTVMLDKGLPPVVLRDLLESAGKHITHAKIGWGIAEVDALLESRLWLYRFHGIPTFCGGTLFEWHWMRNQYVAYLNWLRRLRVPALEISDGVIHLSLQAKRDAIGAAKSRGLYVFAEVGKKDPTRRYTPDEWAQRVEYDLASGADLVVCEGREAGNVGLYEQTGTLRDDVLDALASFGGRVVFEAPHKAQQVALMRRFGRDVGLGNIAPDDVLPLATLRLGLRAETLERDLDGAHDARL